VISWESSAFWVVELALFDATRRGVLMLVGLHEGV